jgi:hypothetical protein
MGEPIEKAQPSRHPSQTFRFDEGSIAVEKGFFWAAQNGLARLPKSSRLANVLSRPWGKSNPGRARHGKDEKQADGLLTEDPLEIIKGILDSIQSASATPTMKIDSFASSIADHKCSQY